MTTFFDPSSARFGETLRVAYSALAGLGAVAVTVTLWSSPARADVRAEHNALDRIAAGAASAASAVITASTASHDGAAGETAASDPLDAPELAIRVPRPDAELLEERVRAGQRWRLETDRGPVHVWVPAGYDAATAATVVFVHGYWVDVDEAWQSFRLAHQFALSGINAMFIVPEAPAAKRRPIAWPSLSQLIRTVTEHVEVAMPSRRLIAVGHSGAYRTLAAWLPNTQLDTVVLLDALYIEYGLLPWLRGAPHRRLVNIVYETSRSSNFLHRRLPSTVRVDGLPHGGLPDSRILYVRTTVGHWDLVTEGVALPMALRAIGAQPVDSASYALPLGLPPLRCDTLSETDNESELPILNRELPLLNSTIDLAL